MEIIEMIEKSVVIAVNATSGGGKTTVTEGLEKCLPNARALYFDDRDYDVASGIDDICQWAEDGSDVNRFDLSLLADDIIALSREAPDFIVLDYPFGYRHRQISRFIDFSVFIDTPLDVAMARRILRDHKSGTVEEICREMEHYLKHDRDVYLQSADVARADADIFVNGCLELDSILRQIADKVSSRRSQLNRIKPPAEYMRAALFTVSCNSRF